MHGQVYKIDWLGFGHCDVVRDYGENMWMPYYPVTWSTACFRINRSLPRLGQSHLAQQFDRLRQAKKEESQSG
jgi:hypothetical protein